MHDELGFVLCDYVALIKNNVVAWVMLGHLCRGRVIN